MLIWGYVGLIAGCGGLGLWMADRIRRRPKELRGCMMMLSLLDTEIVWGSTPLPEAFRILEERSELPWSVFFAELKTRVQKGETARDAWNATILNQTRKFCLKDEDWQIIRDVGKGLGRSDRQAQHKQLELVQHQLAQAKEQATVWADKQAKIWSYLGFLCGIAGAILLL